MARCDLASWDDAAVNAHFLEASISTFGNRVRALADADLKARGCTARAPVSAIRCSSAACERSSSAACERQWELREAGDHLGGWCGRRFPSATSKRGVWARALAALAAVLNATVPRGLPHSFHEETARDGDGAVEGACWPPSVEWLTSPRRGRAANLHYGSCAVVGSGAVLEGRGLGAEIDAHDVTVHVNHVPPDERMRADLGSRTDVLASGRNRTREIFPRTAMLLSRDIHLRLSALAVHHSLFRASDGAGDAGRRPRLVRVCGWPSRLSLWRGDLSQ